jgi:[ribosomal protein S5]-alanine N-acetyltransferase
MSTTSTILRSDELILKELTSIYVTQQYIEWLNDFEVNKYLESRFIHQDKHTVKAFVGACQCSELHFLFGIFLQDNMKHIGNIKLGPINTHHNYAEIGLMIGDKDSWGKGFASKAVSMITQFGFNQLKLDKINAGCYENNIGSKKAFERSGYKVEGFLRGQVKSVNGREGIWKMGCLPSDFRMLKYK